MPVLPVLQEWHVDYIIMWITLHSFVGLKSSRVNVDAVVNSIKGREECYSRWLTTDVLIIDEISQLSRRTFEHINYVAQKVRGFEKKTFGGIQVIVAGDFRQLPPVSNDIDEGQYCFESPLWNIMFPHCVELTEVYRQSQKAFVEVLKQLSSGEVTDETAAFIKAELDDKHLCAKEHGVEFVPHIFCNNFGANFFNMSQLDKLPGEIKVYQSTDSMDEKLLDKVTIAESRLRLKVGAEVMLVYNLSTKLRNGMRGKVVLLEDDGPTVAFSKVGITTKIKKCSWFAYIKKVHRQ